MTKKKPVADLIEALKQRIAADGGNEGPELLAQCRARGAELRAQKCERQATRVAKRRAKDRAEQATECIQCGRLFMGAVCRRFCSGRCRKDRKRERRAESYKRLMKNPERRAEYRENDRKRKAKSYKRLAQGPEHRARHREHQATYRERLAKDSERTARHREYHATYRARRAKQKAENQFLLLGVELTRRLEEKELCHEELVN